MPFTEDHSVFFDTDEFAYAATFDGSTTVNGIFDAEWVDPYGDDELSTQHPMFLCATADVPSAVGKTLVVDGVTYDIKVAQPDGTGQTRLILDEQ